MSTLNLENMNLSEFSESRMESEYNYIDLTKKIKRKSSITEKRNYPNENASFDIIEKNTEENYDNESLHSFTATRSISDKDKTDKISFGTLIFYSLPSFGKMSCLVLLNINSTLYYESLGASLLYMSFFVTLTRCLELIVKPFIAHISDEIKTKMGRRKPFMLIGCGFYALFLVLLFSPPSFRTSSKSLSIWFGVFFVLFFMAESVTIAPYLALGPELSSNSKEREKLYYFFYVFQYVGVLFAAAAPILMNKLFSQCDCSYCTDFPLLLDVEKCLQNCQIICNLRANEKSFISLSVFIGLFFILTIILLSVYVQEKKGSFNKENLSFVPSLHQLINNKAFIKLIIPWICDISVITIYSSMLPFFLNAIINPQKYCRVNNIPLKDAQCSTNYYLGLSISIFFICCIISCNIWHYLVSKFGKVFCWRIFSLFCLFPFSLYLFCGLGTTNLLIIAAIITSFPAGASYLNDVVVSDAIEYDEFKSGKRTEGIYTVCSAFIPKFVSLFAQAIPLSIMSIIGFIPTESGYVHTQPMAVIYYLKITFAGIPMILCVVSYFFKLQFPIKDEINDKIKKGIEIQKSEFDKMKKENINYYKLYDPVFERKYVGIIPNTDENNPKNSVLTKDFLNHFNTYRALFLIYNGELNSLKKILKAIVILCSALFFFSFIILLLTFEYLSEQKYSFIPITDIFFLTALIIVIILFLLKLNALNKVIDGEFELDKKMVKLVIFAKMKNSKELLYDEQKTNKKEEKLD